MNHVVALSGGKDSTVMAIRLAEIEPRDYVYVCTPTGDELPEMVEHWRRIENVLGKPILRLGCVTLQQLTVQERMLPNWRARFCTRMLKIQPFLEWLLRHKPATTYVGLRADEDSRSGLEIEDADIVQRFPLVEWKWGLDEVMAYLREKRIVIPERTDCARCFYQTLYEWWNLWDKHPDIYQSAVDDEKRTRHTYRSPQRDTQPTSLEDLRFKFSLGYKPNRRQRKGGCRTCSL